MRYLSLLLLAGCGAPYNTSLPDSTATLTWVAPTRNTDGSVLTNLAGYKIYYGLKAGDFIIDIPAGLTSYVFDGLNPNYTYYFYITAYNIYGAESAPSNTVSK